MHLLILSAGDGWHVRDLRRAAGDLRVTVELADFRKLTAGVSGSGDTLPHADRVLVRTMPPGSLEQVVFRMDALQRWQAAGLPVLNPPAALEACIDKYLAAARLQAAGITVPETIVCQDADAAQAAFATLGGDVVLKPLFGSEGRGMIRLNDVELAWRTFRTLERLGAVLYVQRFVPHEGFDLRAFVIGGRVVAAMRRTARDGWRTNIAQGGRAEVAALSREQERLALAAAEALKTPVAGVDLLPGRDGKLYLLEVNAVPGWRALAPATGVDIAAEIVRYFVNDYRL
jgi:ribosomal protein S6--L-glutamate ligase